MALAAARQIGDLHRSDNVSYSIQLRSLSLQMLPRLLSLMLVVCVFAFCLFRTLVLVLSKPYKSGPRGNSPPRDVKSFVVFIISRLMMSLESRCNIKCRLSIGKALSTVQSASGSRFKCAGMHDARSTLIPFFGDSGIILFHS
jgi:hypothetical protein